MLGLCISCLGISDRVTMGIFHILVGYFSHRGDCACAQHIFQVKVFLAKASNYIGPLKMNIKHFI